MKILDFMRDTIIIISCTSQKLKETEISYKKIKKIALLYLDVEEFDMPYEFSGNPNMKQQITTSSEGLQKLLPVLEQYNDKLILYTTVVYDTEMPSQIKKMSEKHEIASHSHYHSTHKKKDLFSSKKILEDIINKEVIGFACPGWLLYPTKI
jgi:peptidoglycan/xylan/chitin deacetylase (PgdA/CDA1 family)